MLILTTPQFPVVRILLTPHSDIYGFIPEFIDFFHLAETELFAALADPTHGLFADDDEMPTISDIDKILLRLRFRRPSASSTASSASSSSSNGGKDLLGISLMAGCLILGLGCSMLNKINFRSVNLIIEILYL